MRPPLAAGSPISPERKRSWLRRFRFYRHPPDENAIDSWMRRFRQPDRDVAARILDCVEVVSEQQIHSGYRTALQRLPGWSDDAVRRVGRWFFLGFGKPGESGYSMLRLFREANRMTTKRYDYLFCSITDLPEKRLTIEDNIVFVDDFSGTGNQVVTTWPTVQELIASDAKCYLIVTAATQKAVQAITTRTSLTLISRTTLGRGDNVFDDKCSHFTTADRMVIEQYGTRADARTPKGYGECGLLFVLCHKTPNNTIPILHANHGSWRGLFPRQL